MNSLRHRGFNLLWSGQLVSGVGDMVLFVALPFYVYARTGSALATGGLFVVETIPRFLGPFAGVLVDRWDRRRTMIWVDIARALVLLPILAVGRDTVWILYVVGLAEAILGRLFSPATEALIPSLVPGPDLASANSIMAAAQAVTQLVGPPLGGIMLALLGLPAIVALDAGSFIVSAVALTFMGEITATRAAGDREAATGFLAELREGARLVLRSRLLCGLIAVLALVQVGNGAINVLLVPFVKSVLHLGAGQFGGLLSIQAVGAIVGSIAVGLVASRLRLRPVLVLGLLVDGVVIFAVAHSRTFLEAGLCLLVAGLVSVTASVAIQTMLQQNVEDRHRGRVFGILDSVVTLGTVIGMAMTALLTDRLGVVNVFVLGGAVFAVSGVVAWVMVVPSGASRAASSSSPIREPRFVP